MNNDYFSTLTINDFNALCDDLEELSGGHDHFHVLSNSTDFDAHTVRIAELVDAWDCWLFENEPAVA
jgi:hypothetical protein